MRTNLKTLTHALTHLARSLCLLLTTITSLHASNYYVDASGGADENPGSQAQPWRSLEKVSSFPLQPGDTVYLKRGEIWRETLILSVAGTKDQPITLSAYTDPKSPSSENPVVSCARDISRKLWQGILPNGGFEDTETSVLDINEECYCPAGVDNKRSSCESNQNTFPGWTAKGAGKLEVTQDSSSHSQNTNAPTGFSAQLDSSNNFISITSDAFQLRARDNSDKQLSYRLQGFIRSSPGASIDIALYSTGKVKKYLAGDSTWQNWTPANRKKPFLTSKTGQWQHFEIEFSGIIDYVDSTPVYIDSKNTLITVSIRGNGPVRGWVDDIKLIDHSQNYWSAKTIKNHNPRIFMIDGKRIERGTSQWDTSKAWHAGTRHTVRYVSPEQQLNSSQIFEVGQRRTGIKLDGARHLVIENVTITGCGKSHGRSNCGGAALLLSSGASNNLIRNITTKNSDQGVRVQGKGKNGDNKHNRFVNIHSHSNISGGIALRNYATANTISNCLIHDIGMFENDSEGQDIEPVSLGGGKGIGPGNIVEGCEIFNSRTKGNKPASGIIVFNAPRTIIRNNYLHNIGLSGIVLAAGSNNSIIHHNIINGTGKSPESVVGAGIDIVATTTDILGVKIYNNTIYDCTNNKRIFGGITLRGRKKCQSKKCVQEPGDFYKVRDVTVLNNIVHGCYGKYPIAYYASHTDFSSLTSDHNLFYRGNKGPGGTLILFSGDEYTSPPRKYSTWDSLSDFKNDRRSKRHLFDQNSLGVDPQLAEPDNGNFKPDRNSPTLGAGEAVNIDTATNIGERRKTNKPNIGAM